MSHPFTEDDLDFEDIFSEDNQSDGDEEKQFAPKSEAVENIEALVLSFLSQLSTRTDKPTKIEVQLADRRKASINGSIPTRSIRFPQKTKGPSSKPLAQLFRVANLMHEALVEGTPTTKRDMYYKYVPLFKTQATVDKLVDDLAATFELGRADLNVRASAKGLVCGSSIRIRLQDGSVIEPSDSEGSLIMPAEEISNFDVDPDLAWVLVVEKEAVFQTLCRFGLTCHPKLPGHGLIITGKGYPDVATRELVKTLSDNLPPSIPIVALVDGDPSGIDILSTYIYGSKSMRHEKERLAAGERIEWIGVCFSELARFGIDKSELLPITKYDEKKAMTMLRNTDLVLPGSWRKELMHMIHSRRKAEIEILSKTTGPLTSNPPEAYPMLLQYLIKKICESVALLSASVAHECDLDYDNLDEDMIVDC